MTAVSGVVYDTGGSPVAGRTVRAYRRDTGALLGTATSSAGPAGTGDTSYASTSLILRGNGADASTAITDESVSPKTVSVFGNAQIDTAQSQFGGSSILFDGTGDYLSVPNSAAFDFGSGDFTIEAWLRFNSVATTQNLFGKRLTSGFGPFSLIYNSSNSRIESRLDETVDGVWGLTLGAAMTIATGTWYHFALTRSGTTFRQFVGGVLNASATLAGALTSVSDAVYIGAASDGSGAFNGWMDDIRITKGVARYTADFSASLPTEIIPSLTVLAAGGYSIDLAGYAGELQVVCLDDAGGTTENDLIIRTTGV